MSQYNITLSEGVAWTTKWRTDYPEEVKAFKIDKAEIEQIMQDNPTAAGIRCYMGKKGDDPKLIIVAVDSDGNDILSSLYDHADACPPACDNSSVLCVGE